MRAKLQRFLAYDAADGSYESFDTWNQAVAWLTEDDKDGISSEAEDGYNFIAEVQYQSLVTKTDEKSNYHEHTDECPEDCDEEEWPFYCEFDYIATHEYERIDWDQSEIKIDSLVTIKGITSKCVEGNTCDGYIYEHIDCYDIPCSGYPRKDRKSIKFPKP